ncbi:eukaryotic translation initiation factor 4E transporter-like [Ornithodoros turicata]|uniref:eukaryotic translation initiation factor 4E transporter-like n=1 Tax=Ornithodoros turicata TaxID=34597 RepID=UPI0031394275
MAMAQHDGCKETFNNGDTATEGPQEETVEEVAEEVKVRAAEEEVEKEHEPHRRHQYSKAELLRLRHAHHQRPSCLDPLYNNLSGMWDPERWFLGKRRGTSPSGTEVTDTTRGKRERLDSEGDVPQSGPGQGSKRRSGDPRERVSREDEIVLSPQRRSFGTGCHVSQPSPLASNRHTTLDGGSKDGEGGGGLLLHGSGAHGVERGRRIGSGRILRDQGPQPPWGDRDYGYGTARRFDDGSSSYRSDRRRGAGREDSRSFHDLEEAPEWFVGGPSSQHETIELVGFDEDSQPDGGPKQRGGRRARRAREVTRQRVHTPAETDASTDARAEEKAEISAASQEKEKVSEEVASLQPSENHFDAAAPKTEERKTEVVVAVAPEETAVLESDPTPPPVVQEGFDFNDLFKPDFCPRIFTGTGGAEAEEPGSRFSQWFRRESPPPPSAPEDHEHPDIGSTNNRLRSPPSTEAYFTPISPALPQDRTSSPREKSILDILLDANIRVEPHLINGDAAKHHLWGKAKNVSELEADLKETVFGSQAMGRVRAEDEDRLPLEGLLGKLQSSHGSQQHMIKTQGGLQQGVQNHGFQHPGIQFQGNQSQASQQLFQNQGQASHGHEFQASQPPVLAHLLQPSNVPKPSASASDVLARFLGAADSPTSPLPRGRPSHYPMSGGAGVLLKQPMPLLTTQRPSPTQQLESLLTGDPTLRGPSLGGPLCQSPLPDPHRVPSPLAAFGPHTSPIPQGGSSNTLQVHSPAHGVRVPSPQELAVHTQSILQTALLKKILEEQKQKENLRKQQEARRMQSPSKGTSPTMAAFTPTSVMRKMHLDRSEQPKTLPPTSTQASSVEKEDLNPIVSALNGTSIGTTGGHENGTAPRQYRSTIGRPIMKSTGVKPDPKPFQHNAGMLRPSEVDVVAKLLDQQRLLGNAAPSAAAPGVPGLPPLLRSNLPPPRPVAPPIKRPPPPLELLQQALAHGLHPLAFQQLLVAQQQQQLAAAQQMAHQHMAQQHVTQSHVAPQHIPQPHAGPQHLNQQHVGHPNMAQGFGTASHLHPLPQHAAAGIHRGQTVGRGSASPVNLAKWFGNDVLGQQQNPLPPVPHQKALLLEEVERQQQQPTAVKN